jgi:hypothetical protein
MKQTFLKSKKQRNTEKEWKQMKQTKKNTVKQFFLKNRFKKEQTK